PPPHAGDATRVKLSCVNDDAQGQPLEVLWKCEVDPAVVTAADWHDLSKRGFDPPRMFSAFLHTLRWNCATATIRQALPGAFSSRIPRTMARPSPSGTTAKSAAPSTCHTASATASLRAAAG